MIAIRFGSSLIALLLLTACDSVIPEGHATGMATSEQVSVVDHRTSNNWQTLPKNGESTPASRLSGESDYDASNQHIGSADGRISNWHLCSVNLWHRECNWGLLFTEALSQ